MDGMNLNGVDIFSIYVIQSRTCMVDDEHVQNVVMTREKSKCRKKRKHKVHCVVICSTFCTKKKSEMLPQ